MPPTARSTPGPDVAVRATLSDVAARAGVAVSTASLALSGGARVAAATRARVVAAAAALGYAGPDPLARSLRSRRSGVVGAVVGERLGYAFRDPVAVLLLDGIAEVLGPLGVGLLLLPGDDQRNGPSLEQIGRVPLDAAVYTMGGLPDDPVLPMLLRRGVPVVAVEDRLGDGPVFVGTEDRAGSARLARHLTDLGHRRVAVVTLPLRLDGRQGPIDAGRLGRPHYQAVSERLGGVAEVCGDIPAWEVAANAVEEGEIAGRALLDAPPERRPTAVVAQSDLLALGVVRAAHALGLAVPGEVSVAGFDGVELPTIAPVVLTTVVQPTAEKGRTAGRAVAELLAGRRPPDVVLPVGLRVGTTTGPAPEVSRRP
ncbi:MAG: LacI family DNA-binding transcriptional regulator [Kineosporiaceae bacterium]